MRISVSHVSEYTYDGAPASVVQVLRLTPAPTSGQTVLSWTIEAPGYQSLCSYTDGFGNRVDLVSPREPLSVVRIVARGEVETTDTGGIVGWTGEAMVPAAFLRVSAATALSPGIEAMAASVRQPDTLSTLHALMGAVHRHMIYEPNSTDQSTSAADAFALGRGVCQDHAHIFIAAARSLGIPARYVTGYLLLDDGSGAHAHHAWAEALVDNIGWVGFDATNNLCPTADHIRLGSGLDAVSAAPIRGVRRVSGPEHLHVAVGVCEMEQSQQQ